MTTTPAAALPGSSSDIGSYLTRKDHTEGSTVASNGTPDKDCLLRGCLPTTPPKEVGPTGCHFALQAVLQVHHETHTPADTILSHLPHPLLSPWRLAPRCRSEGCGNTFRATPSMGCDGHLPASPVKARCPQVNRLQRSTPEDSTEGKYHLTH